MNYVNGLKNRLTQSRVISSRGKIYSSNYHATRGTINVTCRLISNMWSWKLRRFQSGCCDPFETPRRLSAQLRLFGSRLSLSMLLLSSVIATRARRPVLNAAQFIDIAKSTLKCVFKRLQFRCIRNHTPRACSRTSGDAIVARLLIYFARQLNGKIVINWNLI